VVRKVEVVKETKPVRKEKAPAKMKRTKAQERKISELILGHRDNGRKLARSILRRWRVRMPTDDIDSIVDLALCEAAERYSAEKGAAFMTFFFYHLRGHLVRTVTRAAQASQLFLAFARSSGVDTTQWQTEVTDVSWSVAPDHFMFGQKEGVTPENELLRKEKIEQCRGAVSKLDLLEQEILTRSFADEEALVDVARSLGYSRCHISRVKKSALDRLKVLLTDGVLPEAQSSEAAELEVVEFKDHGASRLDRGRRRSRRRSISSVKETQKFRHLPKAKAA
jgi:RNA polymerase sigma factor (sigma-70 family)